jgi:hypothetical protein
MPRVCAIAARLTPDRGADAPYNWIVQGQLEISDFRREILGRAFAGRAAF